MNRENNKRNDNKKNSFVNEYSRSCYRHHDHQRSSFSENLEVPNIVAFRKLDMLSNSNHHHFCEQDENKHYHVNDSKKIIAQSYPDSPSRDIRKHCNYDSSSRNYGHEIENSVKRISSNGKDYDSTKERISTIPSPTNCGQDSSPSSPTKIAVPGGYCVESAPRSVLWTKTKPIIGKPKDDSQYYYSSSVECSHLSQKSQCSSYRNDYTNSNTKFVEIMPGVTARLRDTDETWNAIRNDFYSPVMCFACSSNLLCIADAQYVICPDCRVVSPMEEPTTNNVGFVDGTASHDSVGLGFTIDDLYRWQEEIIKDHETEKEQELYQNHNATYYC